MSFVFRVPVLIFLPRSLISLPNATIVSFLYSRLLLLIDSLRRESCNCVTHVNPSKRVANFFSNSKKNQLPKVNGIADKQCEILVAPQIDRATRLSWNKNLRSASWPSRACLFGGEEELYVGRTVKYRADSVREKPYPRSASYYKDRFSPWWSLIRRCTWTIRKESRREYRWLAKHGTRRMLKRMLSREFSEANVIRVKPRRNKYVRIVR